MISEPEHGPRPVVVAGDFNAHLGPIYVGP